MSVSIAAPAREATLLSKHVNIIVSITILLVNFFTTSLVLFLCTRTWYFTMETRLLFRLSFTYTQFLCAQILIQGSMARLLLMADESLPGLKGAEGRLKVKDVGLKGCLGLDRTLVIDEDLGLAAGGLADFMLSSASPLMLFLGDLFLAFSLSSSTFSSRTSFSICSSPCCRSIISFFSSISFFSNADFCLTSSSLCIVTYCLWSATITNVSSESLSRLLSFSFSPFHCIDSLDKFFLDSLISSDKSRFISCKSSTVFWRLSFSTLTLDRRCSVNLEGEYKIPGSVLQSEWKHCN